MWHRSTGILRYDPHRPKLKKDGKWRCVLETCKDLPEYYRWFIRRNFGPEIVCKATWPSHVSVVRGEEPQDEFKERWGQWDGSEVSFLYKGYPRRSGDTTGDRPGNFWFLDVKCEPLQEIRRNLGLKTYHKFHLTVGRIWDT